MNQYPAMISGLGAYLPPIRVTNDDLAQRLDTTDDWIVRRTGIRTRYVALPEQTTSDLACAASRQALDQAGLSACDLDLIILATLSPDQPIPATACFLQHKLGAPGIPAFDVMAACSGFLYALSVARQYVVSGAARHVLVVGAEVTSRIIDQTDRSTCILFGDGAGAAIVSRGEGRLQLERVQLAADGSAADLIRIEAGGSRLPTSSATVDQGQHFVALNGREVFRTGVEKFSSLIRSEMEAHGLEGEDVAQIITHQSNARMIEAAIERTGLPKEKFWCNVERYGNTCSASIPISLYEYFQTDNQAKGAVVSVVVGAGLTWASTTLQAA